MSLPVAVTISGMDSLDVLQQNLEVARGFPADERGGNAAAARPLPALAADGRGNCSRPPRNTMATGTRATRLPLATELPA